MWNRNQKKLTAEEVKALPEGTPVVLHGRDRRGYSTELDCTVVKSQRSSVLRYWDRSSGMVKRMPVRTLDGVVHYYTIEEKEPEGET